MKLTTYLTQPKCSEINGEAHLRYWLFLTFLLISFITAELTLAKTVPASSDTVYYISDVNDWDLLVDFLPSAKLSGVSVYVGLKSPSEIPSYSEPFKIDYLRWAKEIAALSVRYSNIRGFGIKDHQKNVDLGLLRQSYIDSSLAAAKSVNPQLSLITLASSSTDVLAPSVPTLAATFVNNNLNKYLPRNSPFGSTQESWGANWFPSSKAQWGLHILPNRGQVVENPKYDGINYSPSVLKLTINYSDNFSGLASTGTPRAEIFNSAYNWFNYQGDVIKYRFKTFIPEGFQWDYANWQQAMDINQLWLMKHFQIYGSDYRMELQDQSLTYSAKVIGSATGDVGKWVQWEFEFRARNTDGGDTYFIIRKNGVQVYSDTKANLRPGGTDSHLKWGMYKPDWKNATTKVSSLTLFIDDIEIENVTDKWKNYVMDFGAVTAQNGGNTIGDSVAHYVDLTWTNPSEADHDSTYIYSSTTNSTSSAIKIASVSKAVTSYRHTLGSETIRYYWIKVRDRSGNLSSFCPVVNNRTDIYAR